MGDRLEETIKVVEKLEAALHEGRAMLKDIKEERKLLDDSVHKAREAMDGFASDVLDKRMAEISEDYFDSLKESMKNTQIAAEQSIHEHFDAIANLLLHGNGQGRGPSLVDEWAKYKGLRP